jgi:HEAT repeat protein
LNHDAGLAFPELALALMNDPEPVVREEAALSLAKIGPQAAGAVAALGRTLLEEQNARVKRATARTLAGLGPQAVPALIKALDSNSNQTRYLAIVALGRVGAPAGSAMPALVRLLEDQDPYTRGAAAWSLGQVADGSVPTVFALQQILIQDAQPSVRRMAAAALGNLGHHAAPAIRALQQALKDRDQQVRQVTRVALRSIVAESNL